MKYLINFFIMLLALTGSVPLYAAATLSPCSYYTVEWFAPGMESMGISVTTNYPALGNFPVATLASVGPLSAGIGFDLSFEFITSSVGKAGVQINGVPSGNQCIITSSQYSNLNSDLGISVTASNPHPIGPASTCIVGQISNISNVSLPAGQAGNAINNPGVEITLCTNY